MLTVTSHEEIKYITPKTDREQYMKLHQWSQHPSVNNLLNFRIEISWRKLRSRTTEKTVKSWSPISNSGNGECFLSPQKPPKRLRGQHRPKFRVYQISYPGIRRSRREPNNSPASSAQVMLLSTKFSSVLRFQLNEQQKVKAVRVPETGQ